MSINGQRSLLFKYKKMSILEENETGLTMSTLISPKEILAAKYVQFSKVLSSDETFLVQVQSEDNGRNLYIYNLANSSAPQTVFAVTSAIDLVEDAQLVGPVLVIAGSSKSSSALVECWDVLTGQLIGVDHPLVSLITPPSPVRAHERYPGESELAIFSPPKVQATIRDNGEVIYWRQGEQTIESFTFPAIEQHLRAHKAELTQKLDSNLKMPAALTGLIVEYSMFSPKPKASITPTSEESLQPESP
ncbi:hypothetical protein [Legionella sp. km772]|uniref:hypothetical protein n=1 Tax=Legionella sp. km772 TaxID=2498111 RepID=UPI000F8E7E56|nr:hypothetical protein [Legionella sp. km772]RUR10532.1 hypothetical protein ELY15_08005 [Legionella sp. km772]